MAIKTERERSEVKDVRKQPHRFLGLYLTPVVALPFAWLIHVWAFGLSLGPIDFHPDEALQTGTLLLLGAVTVGLTVYAHSLTSHRDAPVRWAFTITVAVLGALFAWNVGTGPHYVISGAFWILSWVAATIWTFPRLNVARKESRTDDGVEKETFFSRIGVNRATKFLGRLVHDEKTGEPVRIEAEVHHAPGETAEVFGDGGIGAMESAAAAPPGMSSVTKDPTRADRSHISIPLVDPFKRNISVGPLSAPGKSIAEWTTVADYANGEVGRLTIGGGLHTPSPTSYALIGMTRAGKTGTETQLLTDWGSRCDWVCLYLNQAKGLQDVRPLLPIIEAAVISEDGEAGLGDYRVAIKKVRAMMIYRQSVLGQFGVSAWTPRCALADDALRPSRVVGGVRTVMPRLPFLTVHLGEADVLFTDGRLSDDFIYVSSKALSLGINTGTSLQKPDFRSMPTNVRSQIGLWFVHGLADSDDEEFVIDINTRKAMAGGPGQWKAKKPGQHYMIGNGVEHEEFAPVALKTRFLIGSDAAPDGRKYTFEELNDRYMTEMLQRNIRSAKTQARLDRGSADATEGWWDEQVAKTDELRARMLGTQPVATDSQPTATATAVRPQTATAVRPQTATAVRPQTATATATRKTQAATADVPPAFRSQGVPQTATHGDDDEQPTAEEMQEMHEEAAEVTDVEGIELYPDPSVRNVDLTREPAPAPEFESPEDDPLFDPEEEAKPGARDRAAAIEALATALGELCDDPELRDPADADGKTVIVGPGMVADRYPFRERPWFSAEMTALAEGQGPLAQRFDLKLAEDLGIRKGKYRLRRI